MVMNAFRTLLSLVIVCTFVSCAEDTSVAPSSEESETSRYTAAQELSTLLQPGADTGLWLETSGMAGTDDLVLIPLMLANRLPVAGFQMDVEGGTIVGAGGGRAAELGFEVLFHENGRVLAFSYMGDALEMGAGVVTELSIRPRLGAQEICLRGIIIGDPRGTALTVDSSISSCTPLN